MVKNIYVRLYYLIAASAWCVASDNGPQVYEDFIDSLPSEPIRTVRYPNKVIIKQPYLPPAFNYATAVQQDPQKSRYQQQQQVDLGNLLQKKRMRQSRQLESLHMDLDEAENTHHIQIRDTRAAKTHLKKKADITSAAINNEGRPILDKSKINRQDNHIKYRPVVYVPNIYKQNFGVDEQNAQQLFRQPPTEVKQDEEIAALNDLIGKNPNVQLEGLKKLLQDPSSAMQQYVAKDHTPITEKTVDVPNLQEKPNIKVEHQSEPAPESAPTRTPLQDQQLAALQAHLDATSKAQAEQVLAKAAQDAFAHVTAQHNAIALARENAQKAAYARVASQNHQNYEENAQNEGQISHQPHQPQRHQIVYVSRPAVSHYALPLTASQPTYQTYQNEAIGEEPSHEQEKPQIILVPKPNLHLQQATGKPAVPFQHVLVETSHQTENVKKVYKRRKPVKVPVQQNFDHLDEFDVQAKYAFGYKIKDNKMGNHFGHEERREGKSAKGSYHVLLPDGRLQTVSYYVDDDGYHAEVSYH